jgi:hypothetical protein
MREGVGGEEWVVTKGLHRARPGQKVTPKREALTVSQAASRADGAAKAKE